MWYQGEIELARAAAAAGVPFTLATGSLTALEKVAEQAAGTLWLQLYLWQDRSLGEGARARRPNGADRPGHVIWHCGGR